MAPPVLRFRCWGVCYKNAFMPIEIKELHIKAVVSAGNSSAPQPLRQDDINKLKKEIIKEVTAKVMKTLKQKNER